jgi:hypothetical protein
VLPRYEIPNHSRQLGFADWMDPNVVLRVVGGMHLTHKEYRVFVHPALDLT